MQQKEQDENKNNIAQKRQLIHPIIIKHESAEGRPSLPSFLPKICVIHCYTIDGDKKTLQMSNKTSVYFAILTIFVNVLLAADCDLFTAPIIAITHIAV